MLRLSARSAQHYMEVLFVIRQKNRQSHKDQQRVTGKRARLQEADGEAEKLRQLGAEVKQPVDDPLVPPHGKSRAEAHEPAGAVHADAKVIDGVGVDGAGWLVRFGSTLSMWWDKWIIDGLLNFGAKLTQLLSFPIRFLQTGTFSSYALLILVGLAILLAYYEQHLHVVLRGAR